MYQEERLRKIADWLREEQTLSNQELMERLDISRDTARRDIIKLTDAGKAIRTHGGIARTDFQVRVENYQARMTENAEGKRKIGRKAAELLEEKGIYFFDVSTHMPYVCEGLKGAMEIYTHSLDNLLLLAREPELRVHCLGGVLQKENRFFHGFDVWEKLSAIQFDAALLGVAAIAEDGLYYEDEEDARIKSMVAGRAKKVIVMADYPKFQRESRHRAMALGQVDVILLDREPEPAWRKRLEKEDVTWIVG